VNKTHKTYLHKSSFQTNLHIYIYIRARERIDFCVCEVNKWVGFLLLIKLYMYIHKFAKLQLPNGPSNQTALKRLTLITDASRRQVSRERDIFFKSSSKIVHADRLKQF